MLTHRLPLPVAPLRWFLAGLIVSLLGLAPTIAPVRVMAAPASAAPAQGDEAEWLVMIYSDADDNVLEQDLLIDLQEAELVGSTDEVTIVAQVDRMEGGYDGMGDWSHTKRLLITQDDDMSSFGSEELEDLGEVNMAHGETLVEFIEWAVTNFPARKHMLILSDHGSGWPGGWMDPDPGGVGDHDILLADFFGDGLWLMEIDAALEEARNNLGLEYFDVIGFDACLMSQLEVYTALAPHALYAVASEEVEPGLGWAYAAFLGELVANPAMEGDELASHIVDSYIDDDWRLEDPEFVGSLSRQQAASEIGTDFTLTAVDLGQVDAIHSALNNFVAPLQRMDQNLVAQARSYAQSYESVFGDEWPSPYVDLGHFSQLIQNDTDDAEMLAAAQELDAAWQAAIVAEKHGDSRPGSTGIAIYFPVQAMYELADNLGYTTVANAFAEVSLWDEFIAFHSGDLPGDSFARPALPLFATLQELLPELDDEYIQVLEDEIAAMIEQGLTPDEIAEILVDEYELPEDVVTTLLDGGLLSGAPQEAPTDESAEDSPAFSFFKRKPLEIGEIWLSAEVAYPDTPVTVATDIAGDRVAFVYSFIGRLLPEDDIMIIEDQDFLFAAEDITVEGVTYPKWPEEAFTVEYEWLPIVYAISDGIDSIRTLFSPESYGDEPIYSVEGIYHFADASDDRYARLFFQEGELSQAFAFVGTANNGTGAPREITPQIGDQFTVLEQGYYLDEEAEEEYYSGESGTLTYGEDSFYLEETPAPSGNYVVGIIAEDLDGNLVESYEGLFVVGSEEGSEGEVTEEGFVPLVNEELGFAMLYPATWFELEMTDQNAESVTLTNEEETALMTVSLLHYDDGVDESEANLSALEQILADLESSEGIENLDIFGEPIDYFLGSYPALWLNFSFDFDGIAYAGELVASTPIPGETYVVYFDAPAEDAEVLLPDLDALLYSFDILISGVDRRELAEEQPEFAEEIFVDVYDDPESGLYDDVEAQEWGQGYYDLETEQYVYAMEPASGAIFDYYADLTLPDFFMLQVSSQAVGALDTAFGLIFQVLDDNHFYTFRVSSDGYFLVEMADGDTLETLVDWTVAEPFDTTEEALNALAVVGGDGLYDLYVNWVKVGEFSDDSYGPGSAGYLVENFDDTWPAAFVFDDFVVGYPIE